MHSSPMTLPHILSVESLKLTRGDRIQEGCVKNWKLKHIFKLHRLWKALGIKKGLMCPSHEWQTTQARIPATKLDPHILVLSSEGLLSLWMPFLPSMSDLVTKV